MREPELHEYQNTKLVVAGKLFDIFVTAPFPLPGLSYMWTRSGQAWSCRRRDSGLVSGRAGIRYEEIWQIGNVFWSCRQ